MKKAIITLTKLCMAAYFMKDSYADYVKGNRNFFPYRSSARKAFLCVDALFLELNQNETDDRIKHLEEQSPSC